MRTPLTSILGFLELMLKETKEDEKINHYCCISLSKARSLKTSIDQLFEFTKINNADLKLNKVEVDIQQLIEQVTMGFIPDFEEKNMECNITSKSGGLKIDADPILLGRAFENIISNTIKYASEGKYLNIVIDKKDAEALISFINYGEEINKDDLENLFDRFYRTKKLCGKKEGTGLGLAIVKRIVNLHFGEVNVTSSKKVVPCTRKRDASHFMNNISELFFKKNTMYGKIIDK